MNGLLATLKLDWQKTKDWFHNSESIGIARLTAFFGFVLAASEGMDWSAMMALDFSHIVHNTQVLTTGGIIFLHGVVSELLRRRNDPKFQPVQPAVTQ